MLDEYGDLSQLVPLLSERGGGGDDGEEKTTALDSATGAEIERKVLLDAPSSGIVLRIVLERYDLASVRDHLSRVRSLLGGNAPYVTSLVEDEDDAEAEEAAVEKKGEKEEGAKVSDSEVSTFSPASRNDVNCTPGLTKTNIPMSQDEKEVKEEDEKAKRVKMEAIAKTLPNFFSSSSAAGLDSSHKSTDRKKKDGKSDDEEEGAEGYDVLFDNATRGGDLADFYYLACGEEETLRKLRSSDNPGSNEGGRASLAWLNDSEDEISGERKKKGKKGKGKKGGGNAGSDRDSSASPVPTSGGGEGKSGQQPQRDASQTERRLYELNNAVNVANVNVRLSGYHPPPPHRRILGDLAYLEAAMPDGSTVHVTAIPRGFYVNRSTGAKFDPTPAITTTFGGDSGNAAEDDDACYSHALLDTLLRKSKSLRSSWSRALSASRERYTTVLRCTTATSVGQGGGGDDDASSLPLTNLFRAAVSPYPNNSSGPASTSSIAGGMMGILLAGTTAPSTFVSRLDTITMRPSWIVPLPAASHSKGKGGNELGVDSPRLKTWDHDKLHSYDLQRTEAEELTNVYGMDIRGGGGGLRDWNEELQSAREMPVETFGERLERAR